MRLGLGCARAPTLRRSRRLSPATATTGGAIVAAMQKLESASRSSCSRRGSWRLRDPPASGRSCSGARRGLASLLRVVRLRPTRRRAVREIDPGELVVIDDDGLRSIQALPPVGDRALCIFEFIYFARPDTRMAGVELHGARIRMGERLAGEAPVDADIVMPVPDSGTPAAIGFARASGIPCNKGLIKNRYVTARSSSRSALREHGSERSSTPSTSLRPTRRRHRRLDCPRYHDPQDRPHAVRGRRDQSAPADLLTTGRLAVLLRDRHGNPRGADRLEPYRGGDPRSPCATSLAYLSLEGLQEASSDRKEHSAAPVHEELPDTRSRRRRARKASLRACHNRSLVPDSCSRPFEANSFCHIRMIGLTAAPDSESWKASLMRSSG